MGGRGGSGGAKPVNAKTKSAVFSDVKPLTVSTQYVETPRSLYRGYYKDTVLQATDKGNGRVELSFAESDSFEKTAKTNKTSNVKYTLDHGFVNDSPHGLNFEKITEFSGKTYQVKDELRRRGYRFKNGVWVKG